MTTGGTNNDDSRLSVNSQNERSESSRPSVTEADLPQPAGRLGNTIAYLRDPFGFITRSSRRGRIVRLTFPNREIYQLTEPGDIERVLVHENQRFRKGELIQDVLGSINERGVIVTEGDRWRQQREYIDPAFGPDRLREYAPTMTSATDRLINRWEDGERRNIHDDLMKLTLEIVANALFGVDFRHRSNAIGDPLAVIMARSENPFVDVIPRWAPTPSNRRFDRAVARIEEIVSALIETRRRSPGADVISTLLAAQDEYGRPSDDEITDQVMTLLLAGHETTALALTFTLYLIARRPGVERRLVAEVNEVLDGRPPSVDDLSELTYTERVVTEAMRLYPPVHTIIRETSEPVTIAGYRFPENVTLSMHQWTVHRDPTHYSDPLAFDPERWTDEFESELPRFAYFPFGGGPRRCLGDRFAMLEARLVIATLVQRVHFELVSPRSLEFSHTITTRPTREIEMNVRKRSAATPYSGASGSG